METCSRPVFLRVKIIISGHTARVRTRRNHGSLSVLYNIILTTFQRSRRISYITFSIGKDDTDGLRLRALTDDLIVLKKKRSTEYKNKKL